MGVWGRLSWWGLVVGVALAGCGREARPAGEPSVALDDPACARFGLRHAPTCGACPTEPLTCPCFAAFEFQPFTRCLWGRCLLSVDCAEVCKRASANLSSPDIGEFVDDVLRVAYCVNNRRCGVDSGCGAGGKCVGETSATGGQCTPGTAQCEQADDCWSGLCVQTFVSRACQDGKPGSPCGADADCPQGRCVAAPPELPRCTRGQIGQPCRQASDCTGGASCVNHQASPFGSLGVCLAGQPGDACTTNDECQSHTCIDMVCSSGEVGALCTEDGQCKTGLCVVHPPEAPTGSCSAGMTGDSCYDDGDCLSHNCALKPNGLSLGRCTDGKAGDPCRDAGDCNAMPCTVPRPPEPYHCGQTITCTGTCSGDFLCYYGLCGATL